MTWHKAEMEPKEVKEIARRYALDLLTASILARRSVADPESIRWFLDDDPAALPNPFLMAPMAEAVERINAAIDSGEKIMIFGDRDVDGITSTVLLFETLKELGADADWMLPEGEETYGLSGAVVKRVAEKGAGLLITVDCGISSRAEVEAAAQAGIDTVVVDHHEPPAELPAAVAILDPKTDRGYPFRDLAGCAVAWKLDWALRFSRTPFFGQPICLINARPGNGTVFVEAVALLNLAETDRITENIVPGMVPFARTRLARMLQDVPVLALDVAAQGRLLSAAFGPECSFALEDMAPLVREFLPEYAGMGLLRVREQLPGSRFAASPLAEIDALKELFLRLALRRSEAELAPSFRRLDLAALGTLADLMPLRGENRTIVRRGLTLLRATERPGLHEIFLRRDLAGKKFGTSDIAWQVSPLLNSAGRMGEPDHAARLLMASTPEEAEPLVARLLELDQKRKDLGEAAWTIALNQAKESLQRTHGRFVLIRDAGIARGVTGIVASRLQNYHKVPAVVVSLQGDRAVGSIRCSRARVIRGFFDSFSDLFENYGGHEFAGGFSLPVEGFEEFCGRFYEAVPDLVGAPEEEILNIDAEVPLQYLNPDLYQVVERFEPYGEGNPPLVFLTRRLKLSQCDIIGRKEPVHLKMLFDSGRWKWPAVFWNAALRYPADFRIGDEVDVVYRLGRNSYAGSETLQFNVVDIRR